MFKISQKLIKILIVFILIQVIFIPISNASTWGDIFNAGDNFINDGKQNSVNVLNTGDVQSEVNLIYNILFALGVVLTVIIAAVLGIKFMVGSIEEQAKVKEMLIPYVAGCIVIFGAFGIWKLILNLISSV